MIVWYIDSIRGVAFPQFFFIGLQAAKFLEEKLRKKDPNNYAMASKISSFEFAVNVCELYYLRALNINELIC